MLSQFRYTQHCTLDPFVSNTDSPFLNGFNILSISLPMRQVQLSQQRSSLSDTLVDVVRFYLHVGVILPPPFPKFFLKKSSTKDILSQASIKRCSVAWGYIGNPKFFGNNDFVKGRVDENTESHDSIVFCIQENISQKTKKKYTDPIDMGQSEHKIPSTLFGKLLSNAII